MVLYAWGFVGQLEAFIAQVIASVAGYWFVIFQDEHSQSDLCYVHIDQYGISERLGVP